MKATSLGLIATSLLLTGCSGSPELHPVRGRLVMKTGELDLELRMTDGTMMKRTLAEAVPMAALRLVPVGPDIMAASALSDSSGYFTVETPTFGQGAMAGRYKVVVAAPHYEKQLPSRYASPETTPLEIEVAQPGLECTYLMLEQ